MYIIKCSRTKEYFVTYNSKYMSYDWSYVKITDEDKKEILARYGHVINEIQTKEDEQEVLGSIYKEFKEKRDKELIQREKRQLLEALSTTITD